MEPKKALRSSHMWQRALLVTGIGVLAAGSVAGVSFALTSSTGSPAAAGTTASSKPSTTPKANGLRRRELQVLRRTVSGDIEIATKNGYVTYEFDRGAVTSISSSEITILRPDGKSVTEAITGTTHMPKRGIPAKGQNVVVISTGGNSYRIVDVGPFHPFGSSSGSGSSSGAGATSAAVSTT
jgi:hypothetical protein